MNYVQSTNFATKDSLPSGDPLKIVRGTEINTEFNNIATAVATKADLVSPTFTGVPVAPTASFGASTAQLATTSFVQAALQALHPVGSIYINATVATNPATLLGFGTWVSFGDGRVMVGLSSDPAFDNFEKTGGSKDAIVVSHTHTATSTVADPGHFHNNAAADTGVLPFGTTGGVNSSTSTLRATSTVGTGITVATTVASAGSSAANANLQPYITVAMWKRTA